MQDEDGSKRAKGKPRKAEQSRKKINKEEEKKDPEEKNQKNPVASGKRAEKRLKRPISLKKEMLKPSEQGIRARHPTRQRRARGGGERGENGQK